MHAGVWCDVYSVGEGVDVGVGKSGCCRERSRKERMWESVWRRALARMQLTLLVRRAVVRMR
jgi:hypothetical protein